MLIRVSERGKNQCLSTVRDTVRRQAFAVGRLVNTGMPDLCAPDELKRFAFAAAEELQHFAGAAVPRPEMKV